MNLIIDIGNTYTKIAVFKQDEMLINKQFGAVNTAVINNFLAGYDISRAIISSVKKKDNGEWHSILAQKAQLLYFNTAMAKGINNHYLTPETLGPDRLAAVIGAKHLYRGKNSLVISGGTCITYDGIDADGNYYGGSISPGLKMRYNALHNYTDGLPLINADESFNGNYGSNTTNAIRSGVQNGIKYELMGFIKSYSAGVKELNIILSGGDSIFFDTLLKNSIFAPYIKIEPYMVLKGLNAALYNNND